jgi:thiol-disulfide isomerase/thioredoxin
MRRAAVAALLLALACSPAPRPHDRDGRPVTINLRGGSVTLLHFWAAWCGPCRQELPAFLSFAVQHHLRVIAISQDPGFASADRFLRENHIAMETLLDSDGRFGAANHIRVIPTTIACDRDGNVIERFDQSVDWRDPAVARRILR